MKRVSLLKRFVIAASVFLVFFSCSGMQTVKADVPDYSAMYAFSGGEIQGFKTSYLDSLPYDNGTRYVDIVIPDSIGGVTVTGIGDSAFIGNKAAYTDVRVRHIDLSAAQHLTTIKQHAFYAMGSMYNEMEECTLTLPQTLKTIGSNAFSGQSKLTGSLILPDSLTEITDSAFMNCGFDGTLKLPDNPAYTQIKKQVFEYCSFQGTLTIPEAVTTIVGNYSFAYNDFTEVILNNQITGIGGSSFKDCSLLESVKVNGKTDGKTIVLPDALTTMGSMIFQNCTVLGGSVKIPDSVTDIGSQIFEGTKVKTIYMPDNSSVTYKSNFLFNTTVNAAVFPSKALYDKYYSGFSSGSRMYFSYPVTVVFQGSDGQSMGTRQALYNRPIHYHETANGWVVQDDFSFPQTGESIAGYDIGFSFTKNGKVIKASDNVTGTVLYYSKSVSVPVIEMQKVDRKTYDGITEYISCEASHPLVGGDGPFKFLYCVLKAGSSSFFYVSEEPFVYPVKDVKDSAQYVCYVQMYDKNHPEYRGKWDKSEWYDYFATQVVISQADPSVTPTFMNQALEGTDVQDLELSLSQGDTPGTLQWKEEDATITKGNNVLEWSYVPQDVGNYKTDITGQVTVSGLDQFQSEDVEQGIQALPDTVTDEQDARRVLNVWRQYLSMSAEDKGSMEEQLTLRLLEVLLQVPGVEVRNEANDQPAVLEPGQDAMLLSCLTDDDARKLLDGTIEKFAVYFRSEKATISDEIKQNISGALNGYVFGECYDMTVEKCLYTKEDDAIPVETEEVTELGLPVQLGFKLTENLKAPAGMDRDYVVLRTHQQAGVHETELLNTTVKREKVTAESKLFSLYTLAYKDSSKAPGAGEDTGSLTTDSQENSSPSGAQESGASDRTGQSDLNTPASTGDNSPAMSVFMGLMTAAVLGCAGICSYRKKRKH